MQSIIDTWYFADTSRGHEIEVGTCRINCSQRTWVSVWNTFEQYHSPISSQDWDFLSGAHAEDWKLQCEVICDTDTLRMCYRYWYWYCAASLLWYLILDVFLYQDTYHDRCITYTPQHCLNATLNLTCDKRKYTGIVKNRYHDTTAEHYRQVHAY